MRPVLENVALGKHARVTSGEQDKVLLEKRQDEQRSGNDEFCDCTTIAPGPN